MFNVGGGEIIAILLIALIVLGPDKLPSAARQAGKYLNEFRRISSGFQEEIRGAMDLSSTSDPTPVVMEPAQPASSDDDEKGSTPTTTDADPTDGDATETGATETDVGETTVSDHTDHADPGVASETAAVATPAEPARNGDTNGSVPNGSRPGIDAVAAATAADPAPTPASDPAPMTAPDDLAATQARLAAAQAELAEAEAAARAAAEAAAVPDDSARA